MARTAVLLAAALLFARSPVSQPQGTIAGIAVDVNGGALPGTTIMVHAGSIHRIAVTDPKGAFSIPGLPPGSYAVVAQLVGFEGALRENIRVTPGQIATVTLVLKLACASHVDYIDNGLPWIIDQSDVIAHIRIPELEVPVACPATPWVNHCACALHNATVVRTLRGEIGQSRQLRLIQEGAGAGGQEQPYGPGDEFIAFLKLDPHAAAFTRVMGQHYVFPVRDGRVDVGGRTMSGFTDGMTVAEFQRAIEAAAPATPQAGSRHTGRVSGIVTDSSGAPIPGATITLRWAESEYTTATDSRGAFFIFDVRPGRYAVIASLQGFYSSPHTGVTIGPGGRATLTFELETDCIGRIDPSRVEFVDTGLAGAFDEADLVAHIRIPALVPAAACALRSHCTCTLHHATVLRVMRGAPLRELRLIQDGAGYGTQEPPYAPGDEFIALLKRDDGNHAFRRVSGPRYMFRVRNGRVDLAGRTLPGFRDGTTVAEFEKALRAMR